MPATPAASPSTRASHRVLLLALVLCLTGSLAPRLAPAAEAATPSAHWGRTTVTVRDETGYPEYRRAIVLAAERWNRAGAKVRLVVAEGRGRGCNDPLPGEVPVCRHTFAGNQVGEARVWADRGHIVRASILLDTRPLPFEHLVAVACHELGHAFGMEHRQERTSCLTAQIHSSEPDARDLERLRRDHGHVPHAEGSSPEASRPSAGPGKPTTTTTRPETDPCSSGQILRVAMSCRGKLLPRHGH